MEVLERAAAGERQVDLAGSVQPRDHEAVRAVVLERGDHERLPDDRVLLDLRGLEHLVARALAAAGDALPEDPVGLLLAAADEDVHAGIARVERRREVGRGAAADALHAVDRHRVRGVVGERPGEVDDDAVGLGVDGEVGTGLHPDARDVDRLDRPVRRQHEPLPGLLHHGERIHVGAHEPRPLAAGDREQAAAGEDEHEDHGGERPAEGARGGGGVGHGRLSRRRGRRAGRPAGRPAA